MKNYTFIPVEEYSRLTQSISDENIRLSLLSDMCRLNALTAVKRAGSGHLGSSFSAMDIVVHLFFKEMNTATLGWDSPDRDIYFSSKGHDVPGLYALLYSFGVLSEESLFHLRRFRGLDGHPDTKIPGIEANSGSLGMGISKGRGMGWGKKYLNHSGNVYVLLGDGELQEGQNYEGLQASVAHQTGNLTVIVDSNKVQSDKKTDQIIHLGDLEEKFQCFGWHVARCNGHDHTELSQVFKEFREIEDKPKILIADTIKGRGVSFMEHPQAMKDGKGYYRWHAGAPADDMFKLAHDELIDRINCRLQDLQIEKLNLSSWEINKPAGEVILEGEPVSAGDTSKPIAKVSDEYVVQAYGDALLEIVKRREDVIVLDADLAADCRIRSVELAYPKQFVECGIAEQDMASMAGGIASQGLLPIVNSFGSFLASRSNEQIYNNATENNKAIYVCHYAGLIPAGPGKSHQCIRDISLFGALPNFTIFQPCNALETEQVLEYAVDEAIENCMIRLAIGPSPRLIELPDDYKLTLGRGVSLTEGENNILFAYGPVMVHEALKAAERLEAEGLQLRVINMPWLNKFDIEWLAETVSSVKNIFVLEDHAPVGGLGDRLLRTLVTENLLTTKTFDVFAVDGFPACGTPPEALREHRLDGDSLVKRITKKIESS